MSVLAVILALVVLNGLFVAAEFALVASRRSRLESLAAHSGAARWLLGVFDAPTGKDRYIAVAQLGITLSSIGLGMYGEPQVAKWIYPPLEAVGLGEGAAHTVGFVVALSLITFLHVVFGEMIPKALALQRPEGVSVSVNPFMRAFGVVFRPLVVVLNVLALALMRALGIREPGKDTLLYTSKELSILTEESAEGGQIGQVQRDLIRNIFSLEDRTAEELMTPRARMDALAVTASPEAVVARIAAATRSRFPVFEDDLDGVVGVLHVKDFIRARTRGRAEAWARLVRPLPSVVATTSAEELLALFKRERIHAALVVDEFGGTLGFVTMDDLVEDVIDDEDAPGDEEVRANADGSFSVHGEATLRELREAHGLNLRSEDVTTVAGLLLAAHGTVPSVGTTVRVPGYTLTAEAVEGLKVERVRVRADGPPSDAAPRPDH